MEFILIVPNATDLPSVSTSEEEDLEHCLDDGSGPRCGVTTNDVVVHHVIHDEGADALHQVWIEPLNDGILLVDVIVEVRTVSLFIPRISMSSS